MIWAIAACGRIHFDPLDDASGSDATIAACVDVPTTRLTTNAGHSRFPSIVTTPDGFALAWTNTPDSGSGGGSQTRFMTIDRHGAIVLPEHDISLGAMQPTQTSIAATTNGFAVIWFDDSRTPPDIYLQRITTDGSRAAMDVELGLGTVYSPTLLTVGSDLYMLYVVNNMIEIARIDPNDNVSGRTVLQPTSGRLDAAWTGSDLAVATRSLTAATLGRFATTGASSLGPVTLADSSGGDVGLAVGDPDFAVIHRNGAGTALVLTRIAGGTTPVATTTMLETGGTTSTPAARWTGTVYAVTWGHSPLNNNTYDYRLAFVDPAGNVQDTQTIAFGMTVTPVPPVAIVVVPGGVALAWQDFRDGNFEIYFTEICR